MNFVFFLASNEGGGNCQRKSKKFFRGTNNGPKHGTCTTSTKSSSKSSKALPLMRSALMHIVSFEIIERLTDCLPSWLASWSSLSHRLSQPGCHCFGWYVPHPPPRWDFFTNWKLCVIFLFWIWIWYYVYLSIYSFPNWSGVIFCVITYTLIV